MSYSNTAQSYGSVAKWFHWTTAFLIIAIIPLGLIANGLPYETDAQLARKATLFSLHKTLGVLVFFVALLRIVWAMTQPKPGELHPDRAAESFLADMVHWMLYGSLVLAPLTGWIHHAATTGFAPIWWPFGQSLPFVPKDVAVAEAFGGLHWIWTKVMGLSVLLHIAGALKHQFIDKDATLARMWFGATPNVDVAAHMPRITAPFAALAVFLFSGAAIGVAKSGETEGVQAAVLEEVQSDWRVLDGTLAISVTQFGGKVDGSFADWTADIDFDPATQSGAVAVEISIGSLTLGSVTDQAMGPEYFNVEQFATASFAGPITLVDGDTYQSDGVLTLKGASVDVPLQFTLTEADGVWSMLGSTELDRRDFAIGEDGGEANLGFGVSVDVMLTATQD